jgi:predicted DNA-binding transcriptional regulator AlpA
MESYVVDTIGAAQRTGLAVPTLEKLRCTGGGPRYCKLGRAVRYRVSDLDDWVASHVVRDTSDAAR